MKKNNTTGPSGKSVSDLLRVFVIITVTIPLLTILFGTNKTDPYGDLEGVLVRVMRMDENSLTPTIKLARTYSHLREAKKNAQKQSISTNLSSSEATSDLQAQLRTINPAMLTLPAASLQYNLSELGEIEKVAQKSATVKAIPVSVPMARLIH